MSDGIHVIESDDYRDEVVVLKKDPILLAMFEELYATAEGDIVFALDDDGSDYTLMTVSSHEYHRRGGTNARSIGGPGRAIKELWDERRK